MGIIKIRGMIHYKGGVRISMLCGRRALEDYRMRLEDETGLSVLLSAKLETVPEAVRRLKEENQSQEARIGEPLQGTAWAEGAAISGEPRAVSRI